MRVHAGWVCIVLFATPLLLVVPLSMAVQFADFPRGWALGLIALSVPIYVLLAHKAAPRPSNKATSAASAISRGAAIPSGTELYATETRTSTASAPTRR